MRYYSSTAGPMSLTGNIDATSTSITVDTTVGLPTSFPYTLVIDPGQGSEEIVQVNSASGSTLVLSRGVDGTSAQPHSLGAMVRHMMTARDLREPQVHIDATSAHGVTGAVVGTTDVQDLSNKRAVAANKDTAGFVVKGAASQAADYFRVEDNGGTSLVSSSPNAALSTGPVEAMNPGQAGLFKRAWRATASAADVVAGIVKAAASQTADIFQVQKSDGTVLARFDKDGNLTAPDGTFTGTVWTDITVAPTFAALNTSEKPQVRRIGKTVYVQGGWANTGMTANTTHVIGTLPVGFRPTQNVVVSPGSSAGSITASVFLQSNGDVAIRTGPTLGSYYKPNATYLID